MKRAAFLLVWLAGLAGGCTTYEWGGYEQKMLAHYQQPDAGKLETSLKDIARKGEKKNRVPPGIYGEIGYLFYEQGKYDEAVAYFEKEKAVWPESALLMEKMIRNARRGDKTVTF